MSYFGERCVAKPAAAKTVRHKREITLTKKRTRLAGRFCRRGWISSIALAILALATLARPLAEIGRRPPITSVLRPLAMTRLHSRTPSIQGPPNTPNTTRLAFSRAGRNTLIPSVVAEKPPAVSRGLPTQDNLPALIARAYSPRVCRAPPAISLLS
jgi:hypothetical protein